MSVIYRRLIPALVLAAVAAALVMSSCSSTPVYKNPNASIEDRVEDLLSKMTLEEKVSQMVNDAAAIERLDVPHYNWWNEGLHGVARAGRATVFPQAIGLAATWDQNLMHRVSTAISDEARAKHQEFLRRGKTNIYQGLTFWSPNINIFRDPRWGRGMETYGEDPYLTGRMAVQFVTGMQGNDPKYLKTVATAKHYAVHSGPESVRHTIDPTTDQRDLWDTYLPQFEMAVEEGMADSVMCAYNRYNGESACGSPLLLQQILRDDWKFGGYVVSDCGAVRNIDEFHHNADTPPQASAIAVKAGTDLNCGVRFLNLTESVAQGLITEEEIDKSVRRLLTARFRLGMFDPPEMVPYAQIPYSVNDSEEHHQLALEAARKSIVLLKNQGGVLPLRKGLGTLAVIGPHADSTEVLLANYNGDPSAPVSALAGIRQAVSSDTEVLYAQGSEIAENMPEYETIPSSALFVAEGGENGLRGEYYNSADFNGELHHPREFGYPTTGIMVGEAPKDIEPVFTRVDPEIAFNWWDGSPDERLNDDDFGIRWTGFLKAPVTGTYKIGGKGFNAFDIYLNGERIVQFHNVHEPTYQYAEVNLEAGRLYPIRVEFFEFVNDASMRLVWSVPGRKRDLTQEAMNVARKADAVIMVMGLSPRLEGEEMSVPVPGFKGGDRLTLDIPSVQEDLIQQVMKLGKPTVLVLMNGSAVSINWAARNVPAIVDVWYPGQEGGTAIADVLFGDYNPAGRLPVTFYTGVSQLPPFEDYHMQGRTYRYFSDQPLYPFGYGLSYTTFSYGNLSMPPQVPAGNEITVSVDVTNSGKMAGEDVVQLYVKDLEASVRVPIRSLAGFERVALDPGQTKTVEFTIDPRSLTVITDDGRRVIEPGTFEIAAGGKQPGFRGMQDAVTTSVVTGRVDVTGQVTELSQ